MAMKNGFTLAALAGAAAGLASKYTALGAQRSASQRVVSTTRAVEDHEPVNVLSPAPGE